MNLVRRSATPLATYRPGSVEDQFGRLVENMFEDFFAPLTAQGSRWNDAGAVSPRMKITENEKAFEIQAEMPGVKKEDVKVAIEQGRVTIEGESKESSEQREGETLVYTERSARKFMRSFMLPGDVDDTSAEARLEDGVLCVTLPKKQGSEARKLTVQ